MGTGIVQSMMPWAARLPMVAAGRRMEYVRIGLWAHILDSYQVGWSVPVQCVDQQLVVGAVVAADDDMVGQGGEPLAQSDRQLIPAHDLGPRCVQQR